MSVLNKYIDTLNTYVEPRCYHLAINKLRKFFQDRGYCLVPTQNRFSILSACEDPENVAVFEYAGKIWALPQTGQMWLEYEILTRPDLAMGVYCETTSYRQEPNAIEGRHSVCFPLFEFETLGDFNGLINLLHDLVIYLGYPEPVMLNYVEVAEKYGVKELTHEHEEQMYKDYGSVCFLMHFPDYTDPFWNMKRHEDDNTLAYKVDVILSGQETIGCAERSCDNNNMLNNFNNLCNGEYKELLFDKFGKERTLAELDAFLALPKVPRFGAGLGMTRLLNSLEKEGIMDKWLNELNDVNVSQT